MNLPIKLWVLLHWISYEGETVEGITFSLETAEKWCKRIPKGRGEGNDAYEVDIGEEQIESGEFIEIGALLLLEEKA